VDDDRELLELLGFALRRSGVEAAGAHDEAAALHVFETYQPDVVVLDIDIAASNWPDLLQELRRRQAGLPVIILGPERDEQNKLEALELGADYVTKPFSHRELIRRILAADGCA
jgi:DNA-binding response OmpR family regulator